MIVAVTDHDIDTKNSYLCFPITVKFLCSKYFKAKARSQFTFWSQIPWFAKIKIDVDTYT
jgi:hypothetical protein